MILTRYNLKKIDVPDLVVPDEELFDLPEKVLQFGTGVLLRGLPDYFIDKANREGIFNGRIMVVKSTDTGSASDFERQDGLYTLYIKGIQNGVEIDEQIINSSISRVLSATKDWETILRAAHNPHLQVIISNTTEIGIQLVQDDITRHPPVSFPGKLLALLYERYKAFGASSKSGLIIIPTELIVDNGKKLESIVLELAHLNKLEPAFMDWLESHNHFCNSLVDRIVPGKPQSEQNDAYEQESGYEDGLRTIAEPYCLWAIEGDEKVKAILSFAQAHKGVIVTPDIGIYRELKLRLLNGTHTLSCAIAFLSGFKTVKEAMDNPEFLQFINQLMVNEIAPAIPYAIDEQDKTEFIQTVIDRFRNPNIEHQWLSISAQYSSKIKMRVLPLLLNHYQNSNAVPESFAFGFAAFLRFVKVTADADGNYTGSINGNGYTVTDSNAAFFAKAWANASTKTVVNQILKDTILWGTDLTRLKGFKEAVSQKLETILELGTLQILADIELKK
ncbi:tagaturonate reductase [Mucilaginibacter jinjuensis]|uniref:Tagaturonate reductase n=1 Tax=Mucilaginibacter jinjuensis TaxID=1176721 RepID=A0ABY7T6M3_9SPHI|nr:tagaturonate reductase [Mucilaginibacter jinjuensis]WCT11914.1 tagaturonate reductase [Mucilaginibacter jinjuensis]